VRTRHNNHLITVWELSSDDMLVNDSFLYNVSQVRLRFSLFLSPRTVMSPVTKWKPSHLSLVYYMPS